MLTLEQLKSLPPNEIFASGVIEDSPNGINMARTGRMLRWVAVRGGIEDWAVYCGFSEEMTENDVAHCGDKVCSEGNIKKLVPCTDEAFAMYRY